MTRSPSFPLKDVLNELDPYHRLVSLKYTLSRFVTFLWGEIWPMSMTSIAVHTPYLLYLPYFQYPQGLFATPYMYGE